MNPASNLILVGPMGAGKSSIGRRLAGQLGMDFIDADQELERRTGVCVALVFELEGEHGFRRREAALLQDLCTAHNRVIATGGGAVLDADNRRLLARSGFVVHLHTGVRQQLARLKRDRDRPLLVAPDRAERLRCLAEQRNPLYAEVADLRFESDGLAVAVAAERLRVALAEHWQRSDAAGGASAASPPAGLSQAGAGTAAARSQAGPQDHRNQAHQKQAHQKQAHQNQDHRNQGHRDQAHPTQAHRTPGESPPQEAGPAPHATPPGGAHVA